MDFRKTRRLELFNHIYKLIKAELSKVYDIIRFNRTVLSGLKSWVWSA